jgi:tetratricopeptide (TPR) repeat protein
MAGAAYREGQNLNFARSVLDLAAIWDDLQPKTLAEVGVERNDALMASNLIESYRRAYKGSDRRETFRLAFAIREAFPDVAGSYGFTGEAFVEVRDWKHAIAEYEKACLLFPEFPDDWQRLGELYQWTGQTNRAQECFSRAKHFAKVVRDNDKRLREAQTKSERAFKPTPANAGTDTIKRWVDNTQRRGEDWGKESSPSSQASFPSANGSAPNSIVADLSPGMVINHVNGADCHIIKYKAGWTEGDLINTRTGPGQNYPIANKIAIGEKGLAMEYQTTSNRGTSWVRVFRWNSETRGTATFLGWANKNFFQFDR